MKIKIRFDIPSEDLGFKDQIIEQYAAEFGAKHVKGFIQPMNNIWPDPDAPAGTLSKKVLSCQAQFVILTMDQAVDIYRICKGQNDYLAFLVRNLMSEPIKELNFPETNV